MSEYSGPKHDADCLAAHASDASCACSRADWLGEMVPRAQARTELLTQLEKWAREREVFETSDIDRAARVNVPMPEEPHLAGWEVSPYLREYLRMGAGMAQSVVRQTWQSMAVRAMHMRAECATVLTRMEAAEKKTGGPKSVPAAPDLSDQLVADEDGMVTLQTTGGRL